MAQAKPKEGDNRTPDKKIGEVKYAEKDKKLAQKSEMEGPAAYAPRDDGNRTPDKPIGEVVYANRDPAKKKTGEF